MQLPGAASLLFLGYLLILLPWLAFKSARQLRRAATDSAAPPLPPRESIWMRTILSLAMLFLVAWVAGSGFGYEFLVPPTGGVRDILACVAALAVLFALRAGLRASRTEAERRALAVFRLAPRTARERALSIIAVLFAGVAEEVAFRGVGMSILWYALGSPWVAMLICATAFAAAHWMQGWKSGIFIFLTALVMHGLVAITGTLIFAMGVHVIYDLVAGYWIAREATEFDRVGDDRVG